MKNQESLKRIIETKFHDLDNKVTEIAMDLGKLKDDFDARIHSDSDEQTTTRYEAQPRPAQTAAPVSVPPPVSTPPVHRLQQKHSQTLSSPLHRPTQELPARRLLHHLQLWIEPRVTLRHRSFELFGNLLPKGESDIDLRASSERAIVVSYLVLV